ncbi:hypothetical protein CBS101457_000134 [Exobasidium rhododendri]|nr:hypothetical protein CBS101457_000134 [Exobasidium rhododendri]
MSPSMPLLRLSILATILCYYGLAVAAPAPDPSPMVKNKAKKPARPSNFPLPKSDEIRHPRWAPSSSDQTRDLLATFAGQSVERNNQQTSAYGAQEHLQPAYPDSGSQYDVTYPYAPYSWPQTVPGQRLHLPQQQDYQELQPSISGINSLHLNQESQYGQRSSPYASGYDLYGHVTARHPESTVSNVPEVPAKAQEQHNTPRRTNPPPTPNPLDGHSWHTYGVKERLAIVHMLHLHTGFLKESIAAKCRKHFTDTMRSALLSGDYSHIQWVKNVMYPPEQSRHAAKMLHQIWMDGMSMEDSIRVVKRMSMACGVDEEHVRNFFLRIQMPASKGQKILAIINGNRAESHAVIQRYVVELGLDRPNNEMIKKGKYLVPSPTVRFWPWMRNISEEQKKIVIKKLMAFSGLTKEQCFVLLKQPQIEEEMGRTIYTANNEEMMEITQRLASVWRGLQEDVGAA